MARQAEKSETTRAALVAAARELFSSRGYAAVGTTEIVTHAGSSRGAMYHHFRDKADLFRAVYEQVQTELIERVAAAMEQVDGTDPVVGVQAGLHAFLLGCVEPDKAQIGLIDGPAVLGWRTWRELDQTYALGMVSAALELGAASGAFRSDIPIRPLAHMIVASLGEAAMYIVASEDRAIARAEVEPAVLALLDGLRA